MGYINYCYLGRHNTYYFRLRTPKKIINLFPEVRKERRISLKTGYLNEARCLSNHIFNVMSRFYVDLFFLMCNNIIFSEGFTEYDINKQIDEVINFALGKTTKGFETMFNINSLINRKKFGFETHNDGIRLKSLQGETKEERSADYKLYEQYIKLLSSQIANLQANHSQTNSIAVGSDNLNTKNKLKKAKFSDLIEAYAEHKKHNGWENQDTFLGYYQKLQIILDLVGDIDCYDISQDTANQFLKDIVRLPVNSNKGKLSKLSLKAKLELPGDKYKKLSKASISKYVSLFKALSKFGSEQDPGGVGGLNYLSYDVAKNLIYKFNKSKDFNSYSSFTENELKKIFTGYVYTDKKTTNRKSDDFIFWMPLLAAYTGARVNELAQLLVSDIRLDNESNIWYINVLDDENKNNDIKQTVKTNSSKRKVPIQVKEKSPFILSLFSWAFWTL